MAGLKPGKVMGSLYETFLEVSAHPTWVGVPLVVACHRQAVVGPWPAAAYRLRAAAGSNPCTRLMVTIRGPHLAPGR